jgi:hypothetical protein
VDEHALFSDLGCFGHGVVPSYNDAGVSLQDPSLVYATGETLSMGGTAFDFPVQGTYNITNL